MNHRKTRFFSEATGNPQELFMYILGKGQLQNNCKKGNRIALGKPPLEHQGGNTDMKGERSSGPMHPRNRADLGLEDRSAAGALYIKFTGTSRGKPTTAYSIMSYQLIIYHIDHISYHISYRERVMFCHAAAKTTRSFVPGFFPFCSVKGRGIESSLESEVSSSSSRGGACKDGEQD